MNNSEAVIIRAYNLGDYVVPDDVYGGVCVDIGSNVGSFVEQVRHKFKLIHYYEPYQPCFYMCSLKLRMYGHIMGYNEAVLDKKNPSVELVAHHNNDSGSIAVITQAINQDWDKKVIGKVESVDLPTVLERAGGAVDYLKCDVETSEYYIFLGKSLTAIKYIAAELHWQMGEIKYNNLMSHITKSHSVIIGDPTYKPGINNELLFKNKALL
jgi:FkbM family methyltransferase